MTLKSKMAAGMTVAAMAVTPMALASGAAAHGKPATKPHTTTTKSSKAEEYGKLCNQAGTSHKRTAGQKGTPFSRCVAALRAADATPKPTKSTPAKVCKAQNLSTKHVAGQKGTPYSQCVSAAAKLLASKHTATATS